MTHDDPHQPSPGSLAAGARQADPLPTANGGRPVLGERAAGNLVQMSTTPDATILDLDDDPTLEAASLALGRSYLAVELNTSDAPPHRPADLAVLCWPRPGDHSWLSTVGEVFAGVHALLARRGQVAVLLDPTPALAYGITWTGTLLAAASAAGLPVLQDVVCVHDVGADAAGQRDAPAPVALRHRVILVLGTRRARHAER